MMNQQETGNILKFRAMQAAIDAIPCKGDDVDWESLKLKKEVAQKVLAQIDEFYKKDGETDPSIRCDDWWPKVF